MVSFSRRDFLAASMAASVATQFPRLAHASGQTPASTMRLTASSRTLDVNGRAATVWSLQSATQQGLVLEPEQRFRVELANAMPEPTLIHWHGQIPPNAQDGVPDLPMPMLKPGETRQYDFAARAGTHWMHAHIPMQEMRLLAAPLIVRTQADVKADQQEVVMMLHDFAFDPPQEVIQRIAGGHTSAGHSGMNHGAMPKENSEPVHSMAGMNHSTMMSGMSGMGGMEMDLNDYDWDAYLTNDRTLTDPEVVRIERNTRIRLRIINAASATVFWIDTGTASARLVAVDGEAVQPLAGTRFGISMGQRLDVELQLSGSGAWPILALREGAQERTGLILATQGAKIPKLSPLSEHKAPAFDTDLAQESRLVALNPLPQRTADRSPMLMLGGTMQPYRWTINNRIWGEHAPVTARSGERVEIMFHNMSMMAHPMHLHGHSFQVVEINGKRMRGARRDTVHVPPMATVTIALDAGEAARWMLHCHHMPHLETGMMTEFAVS
ncbi:multicopper oxidase family protein [Lampropedia puyangensis]|uniref:Multicopper oxidase family protein n=1 Tax=Lampropedia puyangensis TaxID=1330072 RepID=A0A4S8FDK6_9BURK|nr:multicopper oxidase family protein [Lampropedia puyangensis]THU05065.1 multicopper oxidase family protein [Lampropedia puyangensis]